MSDNPRDTWLSILSEKQSALSSEEATSIRSEAEFRRAFESLCAIHKEHDAQRLQANLLRQHVHVTAFLAGIDAASNLHFPDSLSALFWAVAFETIQVVLNAGKPLLAFVKLLKMLNNSVPHFGAEIQRFPEDPYVQKPLQEIFQRYIDCFFIMANHFSSQTECNEPSPKIKTEWAKLTTAALDSESIEDRINFAHSSIADLRSEWEKKVKIAAENEARRLRTFDTVSSYPNGLHGERLPSYSTKADFKFRRRLGSGAFGQVAEVIEPTTNQVYARKVIAFREDSKTKGSIESEVLNEVSIMQRLRHQHIASVLFFVRQPDAFSIFMLPVADCDLLFVLESSSAEDDTADRNECPRLLDTWFGCLISALAYAHNLKIKHEDIKPSNILIKDKQPYLADFGSAKDFAKLDLSVFRDDVIKGTPVYLAPEPVAERGRAADIFALGCVFSEMLTVRQGRTMDEYRDYRRVPHIENGLAFRADLQRVEMWLKGLVKLGAMGRDIRDQTLAMLRSDPEMRPSATDVKKFFRREEALFCESC